MQVKATFVNNLVKDGFCVGKTYLAKYIGHAWQIHDNQGCLWYAEAVNEELHIYGSSLMVKLEKESRNVSKS